VKDIGVEQYHITRSHGNCETLLWKTKVLRDWGIHLRMAMATNIQLMNREKKVSIHMSGGREVNATRHGCEKTNTLPKGRPLAFTVCLQNGSDPLRWDPLKCDVLQTPGPLVNALF
jgi:hypothetical protein